MTLEIKIVLLLLCSALFWLGGKCWLPARRFLMPILIGGSLLWYTSWDWYALTSISAIGIFCLGYGVNSPLRHCFGNGWGRGIWGILSGICLSLGVFLTGHLYWFLFVPYLAVNFTFENALKNLPQAIGDPIIGVGFSSIIFIVH